MVGVEFSGRLRSTTESHAAPYPNPPGDAMKLGRLPHSPAQLAALPNLGAHRMAAFQPPPKLDRSRIAYQPRVFGNDTLPDCTAAGLANAVLACGAINGFEPVIQDVLVPAFYASCVGCEPTPTAMAATAGAVMADVLARQAQHGVDLGEQAPFVGRYATVPTGRAMLATTMVRLGLVYVGVTLRERDMQGGAVWDVTANDGGVEGGHCLLLWDYAGLGDDDTVRLVTWGGFQAATWRWVSARLEESYGIVWRQLATPAGLDIGVDVDLLAGSLAA